MNAEAYFARLERRTTVLFLLLLVQAVVMFVFWAVTPAPAEPPVLPVKDVPAELGSKGNPIECLYVSELIVVSPKGDPRIELKATSKSVMVSLLAGEDKRNAVLLLAGSNTASMILGKDAGKTSILLMTGKNGSTVSLIDPPNCITLNTDENSITCTDRDQRSTWPP